MKNTHQFYRARRAAVLKSMHEHSGGGLALVPTAPEVPRNRDSNFPFRFDSYFHYLSGFPEPEAVVDCDRVDVAAPEPEPVAESVCVAVAVPVAEAVAEREFVDVAVALAVAEHVAGAETPVVVHAAGQGHATGAPAPAGQ